jgi:hypothetical protein
MHLEFIFLNKSSFNEYKINDMIQSDEEMSNFNYQFEGNYWDSHIKWRLAEKYGKDIVDRIYKEFEEFKNTKAYVTYLHQIGGEKTKLIEIYKKYILDSNDPDEFYLGRRKPLNLLPEKYFTCDILVIPKFNEKKLTNKSLISYNIYRRGEKEFKKKIKTIFNDKNYKNAISVTISLY